jgi:uncharacterized protein
MGGLRLAALALAVLMAGGTQDPAAAQPQPPALTSPVNDFAGIIDAASARTLDRLIRSLQQASGDVIVVATVETVQPYADIREYAVKMFENGGRGIGTKGQDNGALVLVAVTERQVRVEVGYDLESIITDGFAGEVSRLDMVPSFRRGDYGAGLVAGVGRLVDRVAAARNVTLTDRPVTPRTAVRRTGSGGSIILALFVLFIVLNALGNRNRRRSRYWGGTPWSTWHSGVGPFGGPRGGGFGGGGGGFGGGFGGFGGGRSGGGGGGAGW